MDQMTNIHGPEQQIDKLYVSIDKGNESYWPGLIGPGDSLSKRPDYTSSGNRQETWLKLQCTYPSWMETLGAIEYVESLHQASK